MNDLFLRLGIEAWKPLLGSLSSPPVLLILLMLFSAGLIGRRRVLGWCGVLAACLGLWLMCCSGLGHLLLIALERPQPPMGEAEIAALASKPATAIVVLGAGRIRMAPEYGDAQLKPMSFERLRYGLWLARKTHLPVAYSGGPGFGNPPGPTEAELALRTAGEDFKQPLRWIENRSRDTNENAIFSVELMAAQGVKRIVLVTHGFHMPRALAAFERALRRSNTSMDILPASMGLQAQRPFTLGDWLPSSQGLTMTLLALHEWLGRRMGA